MSVPKCPVCNSKMVRNGRTAAGTQRRNRMSCKAISVNRIDNAAK